MTRDVEHTYRYRYPSALADGPEGSRVLLATSGGVADHPYFFQGALRQPRLAAQALRTLSAVVAARHHVTPAMIERLRRQYDPVVTSGGGMLRFEGFSACASAYARVDLTPDAYDGVVVGQGTTNVDFNSDFRAALVQISDGERVGFAVGADEVTLLRGAEQIVERRVKLPMRWAKGFAEVQAHTARMQTCLGASRVEAVRFLRSLPRRPDPRMSGWVIAQGGGLRLSQVASPAGVRVAGLARLRVLEDLAPLADGLRIHASPSSDATSWELDFGALRFSLTISAETWRGFSGEGQVLSSLAQTAAEAAAARLRPALRWQADLPAQTLAREIGLPLESVRAAFSVLGTQGLVGYDLARKAYFHRELPFARRDERKLHPRLAAARKIVDTGGVRLLSRTPGLLVAEVAGTGTLHCVRIAESGTRCTCPWHAKHQGARGPCKHILAVNLALAADSPSE